jgi:hypothetical protein
MLNHLAIARIARGYSLLTCRDHSRTAAAARERARRRGIHRHVDTAVGERSAALSWSTDAAVMPQYGRR